MKKTITFFCMAMIFSVGNLAAESVFVDDFEDEINKWDYYGGVSGIEVVDNPSFTGNNSTKVLKMSIAPVFESWAAIELMSNFYPAEGFKIGPNNTDGYLRYFHMKMYRSFTSKFLIEFSQNPNIVTPEITTNSIDEWEYIIVDLAQESWAPLTENTNIKKIAIQPMKSNVSISSAEGYDIYFDDIFFSDSAEETDMPEKPTKIDVNVTEKSVFVNRTNESATISVRNAAGKDVLLQLINMQGIVVKTIFSGSLSDQSATFSIDNLGSELYIIKSIIDGSTQCVKF